MSVIKRVLSEEFLDVFRRDFSNLLKIVRSSYGELDLAIRDNYLNLYFKGNSLAKISYKSPEIYSVSIHEKFFEGTKADDEAYFAEKKKSGKYVKVILNAEKPPRRFLQKAHIGQFCSRVNDVNYGEEIVFEQAIITDNMGREDLIIIDRQITDYFLRGKRLDLLGLQQINPGENMYRFLALEVKLGKNLELKEKVASQLKGYQTHIQKYVDDYIRCYQKQFEQKKSLGIIGDIPYDTIEIENEVQGWVVVGGYSKMADASISELEDKFPEIEVRRFSYFL
jgi:hypothetical protein